MHIVTTVYIVYIHSYMRVIAYRKWARGGEGIHTHLYMGQVKERDKEIAQLSEQAAQTNQQQSQHAYSSAALAKLEEEAAVMQRRLEEERAAKEAALSQNASSSAALDAAQQELIRSEARLEVAAAKVQTFMVIFFKP